MQPPLSGFVHHYREVLIPLWEVSYFVYVLVLALLAVLALMERATFGPALKLERCPAFLRTSWFFLSVALVGQVLLQLPLLAGWELGADESTWMAASKTLTLDPWFWHSVDGTTAGPLVLYPLTIFPALGWPLDYGFLRLLVILTGVASLACLYGLFCQLADSLWARLLILPYAAVLGSMAFEDQGAYNSEHPCILFLSLALYFISVVWRGESRRTLWLLAGAGFLIGLMPYAKVQSVPLGVAVAGVTALWLGWRRDWPQLLVFVLSGLVPSLLLLVYLVSTGGVLHFWNSYIVGMLAFGEQGFFGFQLGYWDRIKRVFRRLLDPWFYGWLMGALLVLPGLLLMAGMNLAAWWRRYAYWWAVAVVLLVAGFFVVVKPMNLWAHHFLFLYLPVCLSLGLLTLFALKWRGSDGRDEPPGIGFWMGAAYYLAALLVVPVSMAMERGNVVLVFSEEHFERSHQPSAAAERVLAYTEPGDRLSVWGYSNWMYVETNLAQGTREAMSQFQIQLDKWNHPLADYYLQRYVDDLRQNRPRVIVDHVGPDDLFFRIPRYRIENYPLVWSYLQENYDLVEDSDSFRLYLRRPDPASSKPSTTADGSSNLTHHDGTR
ncbi:MAG: hypothetical protein AAGK14_04885 [Verrucomicrobiota bacterium]